MSSTNTNQELDDAVTALCKLRGVPITPKAKVSNYASNQARLRGIEEAKIERGEIDSEGGVLMHEAPAHVMTEKQRKQLENASTKSNFNKPFKPEGVKFE